MIENSVTNLFVAFLNLIADNAEITNFLKYKEGKFYIVILYINIIMCFNEITQHYKRSQITNAWCHELKHHYRGLKLKQCWRKSNSGQHFTYYFIINRQWLCYIDWSNDCGPMIALGRMLAIISGVVSVKHWWLMPLIRDS